MTTPRAATAGELYAIAVAVAKDRGVDLDLVRRLISNANVFVLEDQVAGHQSVRSAVVSLPDGINGYRLTQYMDGDRAERI